MKLPQSARALFLLTLAASPALAQKQITPTSPPAPTPGSEVTADGRRTLNMKDADIEALIATVSEITGKNFIVSPLVQGKVTVVGSGFYGSTTAQRLAEFDIFDEVVITDIIEGKPEGIALDISQSRSIEGFENEPI